jgi:hypothetical protein
VFSAATNPPPSLPLLLAQDWTTSVLEHKRNVPAQRDLASLTQCRFRGRADL